MENIDRIVDGYNVVGNDKSLEEMKPGDLPTVNTSVYRVTGMDQIQDIIECGYVRPKGYGNLRRMTHIYWSHGNEELFYSDKRPVIEASADKVVDEQKGAIPLSVLKCIWLYEEDKKRYVNRINVIRYAYNRLHQPQDNNEDIEHKHL